ncbi:hypothetical protein FA10DRAFT_267145 [Acaromyces ingoldii]|uniref:Eukaryotic translation initiation factor 3 subunit C n=1 Tax=Acaromyces ingoldii TaxID=215250 RepID=A0A316YN60_9BASI|nr:hypothetical protein FA10DRAFT_267145 [Acaromyces ingoldii]PWN90699.1 hypothetical protein FA10DRAFT_267145 [Acaromyces ingoldii]
MSFFRKVSDSEESDSESEEELMSDSDEEQQTKKTAAAGKKKADDSDADSDEDSDQSDDDSDDDGSDDDDEGAGAGKEAPKKQSRFLRGASDDSDSEEETKKVIKSAKDKRADEIEAVVKNIENAQRIDDWVAISKEFDSLNRLADRQRTMQEAIPTSYIKAIDNLENFLTTSAQKEKTASKKMKAPNAKAMNGMKQKLKKVSKDNEDALARFRENPEAFEAAAAAAAAPAPSAASQAKKKKPAEALLDDEEPGEGDDDFQTVGRGGKAVTYTSEGLFKSLASVMEARGRKATDRSEQVQILTKLLEVAASTYQKIRVLLALVAARYDYNQSAGQYMSSDMWNSARKELDQLIDILVADRTYVVREETEDYDDEIDRLPNQNGEGDVVAVRGSTISFIERLDDEFTKSLQNIDPHAPEYVERLSDEKLLYQTIIRAQVYYEQTKQTDELSRAVMRRIEHVYAKQDNIVQALEAASASAQEKVTSTVAPSPAEVAQPKGPTALVRALCVLLYKTPGLTSERLRSRAMLCHIYHHALHVDYYIARDMFLMSHLQDLIAMADAPTQILYNRVVVQLGVCAFRLGLIKEAQAALQDIFASTRVKELLAQGVQRQNQYSNLTPEQEKMDRQRQLPFHMHINLELLECVYLTSSMLLEIPNIAYAGNDPELKRRVISRNFRKMLDFTDRQVFSGPPESTRDHIMMASKALQNGDWKECTRLINEIKIWKLMVNSDQVKEMLAVKIQEEGLKTYLFSYSCYYRSVSIDHLSSTFDLEPSKVRSLVSAMIWNEELVASLDPIDNVVVLHRVELSKVQQLAQTLAEKANSMLEQNERALDAKLGDAKVGGAGGAGSGERGERGEGGGGRREGRRGGGAGGGRGRGRGRGRAQFNALPGQQKV